jgi:hypothetical protein
MKTVYSSPIIAISFWFLIPALIAFYEYNLIKEYSLITFHSLYYIGVIGVVLFIITFLRGMFPLQEEQKW